MNAKYSKNQLIGLAGKFMLAILLIIEVYPLLWIVLSSVKSPSEFTSRPMYDLPLGIYWQNFVDAWSTGHMNIYFRNSAIVTFPSLFISISLSSAAAFGIEKLKWKWSNRVLFIFLAGIMVPVPIILLPLFTIFLKLSLINNLWGLIITYTAFGIPLQVFLFSSYFKTMPNELMESAVIDGANIYQIFLRIALPMVRNSIVTVALVQFFFTWNDLILSLTFICSDRFRPGQRGRIHFQGEYGQTEWGPTFASLTMAVIPTLIIYLFLNKSVMKGLTSGAVKG